GRGPDRSSPPPARCPPPASPRTGGRRRALSAARCGRGRSRAHADERTAAGRFRRTPPGWGRRTASPPPSGRWPAVPLQGDTAADRVGGGAGKVTREQIVPQWLNNQNED